MHPTLFWLGKMNVFGVTIIIMWRTYTRTLLFIEIINFKMGRFQSDSSMEYKNALYFARLMNCITIKTEKYQCVREL